MSNTNFCNGLLIWNGDTMGTAGSAGGWIDAGPNVYLSTSTDKVGIGDSSPTYTLDVAGKIGINDTQALYIPGSTFTGTFIMGDGGGSLNWGSGIDGWYNTGVGIGAINANTIGCYNTAIGYNALRSNIIAQYNTAIGYAALQNSTGDMNTAIGGKVLEYNTEGRYNTATGYMALNQNTSGICNTATGLGALYDNSSGEENTASGFYAFHKNTTGNHNTGIGYEANYNNQTGSNNTVIGYEAGRGSSVHNKSGNVFIGYQAGYNETADNKLYIENSNSSTPLIGGDFSTDRVGINTGSPNNTLDVNGTAEMTGFKLTTSPTSGYVLTSDASGTGTWQAAAAVSDGDWTISGDNIYTAVSGKVGIGTTSPDALLNMVGTSGEGAPTYSMGTKLAIQNNNTDDWAQIALTASSTGTAGFSFGDNSNYAAGSIDDPTINFLDNTGQKAVIGWDAGDGVFKLTADGTIGGSEGISIEENGDVGIGNAGPTHKLDVGTNGAYCDGGAWIDGSSRSYKENIKQLSLQEAMETLTQLDPVTFSYKTDPTENYVGFIAEDVPELVSTNDRKGLSPMDIVAVLTKVTQKQQQLIEDLQKQIDNLKK